MQIIRRSTVAALAAAALTLAPVAAAEAAPHGGKGHTAHATHSAKALSAQARAALREVAAKDRALARVAASRTFKSLADAEESVLAASIAADRAALSALGASVRAGTTPARTARATVRTYRAENYLVAVAVLRGAAGLRTLAGGDADVLAALDSAVATTLTLTATNGRTVLRAAKAALEQARDLVEALDDSDDSGDPDDPDVSGSDD